MCIRDRVSYYSARKTFAQHGYDIGIEIEKIEYCIGHSMKNNRPIFNYIRIMQNMLQAPIFLLGQELLIWQRCIRDR